MKRVKVFLAGLSRWWNTMSKKFASHGDLAEKQISFTEIGRDLWAFTAEGDQHWCDHRR